MEIESFQNPKFNAITWINTSFKNIDSKQNKETFVLNLVSKLQLYVEQVNSALEGTSQQVLVALPKIMKDAQNLQHDATLMRNKMSEIQNNIAEVQRKTGDCMGKIEQLDALKTKLQTSKQGLQESDGWGLLTTELEDLLKHKDDKGAFNKLILLEKSLSAQIGLPGQAKRESQIECFKTRIEALVIPKIIKSFSLQQIDDSKYYANVYKTMDRHNDLTYYYRAVSKNYIRKKWSEISKYAEDDYQNNFIRQLYNFLLEYWSTQYQWCNIVFGTIGLNEPTCVLIEILTEIEPSRETIIDNSLTISESKLKNLQEFSNATMFFGSAMQKKIDDIQNKPTKNEINALNSAIFDFFPRYFAVYASSELTELKQKIDELNLLQSVAAESVRNFANGNSKLFKWCEEALQRCNLVTQNIGLPELIAVFNKIFAIYLRCYKIAQRQLYSARGNVENWSLVLCCVTLLQHIGNFVMQLEEFENFISEKIMAKETEMANKMVNRLFGYKFVGKTEKKRFSKLVAQMKNRKNVDYSITAEYGQNRKNSIFETIFEDVKQLCEYIHDTMTTVVFKPIKHHMSFEFIGLSVNLSGSNLPDYSFAPQEMITQVGQYLLTLPQHLEPLLLAPSQQLKTALRECDENYPKNVPSVDILLSIIVDETCALYEKKIMQLSVLNDAATKQLATDIKYFRSVLEDLGMNLAPRLHQISVLIRASPENYLNESVGFDPKLVTSIRQIRHIVSVD